MATLEIKPKVGGGDCLQLKGSDPLDGNDIIECADFLLARFATAQTHPFVIVGYKAGGWVLGSMIASRLRNRLGIGSADIKFHVLDNRNNGTKWHLEGSFETRDMWAAAAASAGGRDIWFVGPHLDGDFRWAKTIADEALPNHVVTPICLAAKGKWTGWFSKAFNPDDGQVDFAIGVEDLARVTMP